MTHFECRKCGSRFKHPEAANNRYRNGISIRYNICPVCKVQDFVPILCAFCTSYVDRSLPCLKNHRTIVPYNVSCDQWSIRSKTQEGVE